MEHFYSVRQAYLGADSARKYYFDSLEKAKEYYRKNDYTDKPVEEIPESGEDVTSYEFLCNETSFELSLEGILLK